MENVISVIIPVYNVQAYLPECLDSVISQDYRDLEIILINDGSKDDSGKICDEYAAKDPRIRVIHQVNAGAGAAKNAGLRAATGEYLSFVDSDDYLEPGAYSHMVAILKTTGADMIQCAFRYCFMDRMEKGPDIYASASEDVRSCLVRYTLDPTLALLWDKLYKRSLFDGIYFEEGNVIDDEFFTYQGVMNAKTIAHDDRVIYNYRIRKSSVMHAPHREVQKLADRLAFNKQRRDHIIKRYPELRSVFDRDYLESLIFWSRSPYNTEESFRDIKGNLKAYFREKGHTVPKLRRWPALLVLHFGSTRLLKKLFFEEKTESDESMFL